MRGECKTCVLVVSQERLHLGNLKRLMERLPLEASAVTTAAPHLATLTPLGGSALLKELASDNHAYRCVPRTEIAGA